MLAKNDTLLIVKDSLGQASGFCELLYVNL